MHGLRLAGSQRTARERKLLTNWSVLVTKSRHKAFENILIMKGTEYML